VLTADLVSARRRGGELYLVRFDESARSRARTLAGQMLAVAVAHVGRSREELLAALGAIEIGPRELRLRAGFAKLIADRCEFETDDDADPESLRRDVFARASQMRSALDAADRFDRTQLLRLVAQERGTSIEAIERALFADLRGAHFLTGFVPSSPDEFVATYERAQAQAVLLRAVKVSVDVRCASPETLRSLFRRLKFLRLLHTIEKTREGHRIAIDGPFSLFESVTRYGLQLALVLPALEQCEQWHLKADVRWGKDRAPLLFRLAGGAPSARPRSGGADCTSAESGVLKRDGTSAEGGVVKHGDVPSLPDHVQALVREFRELKTPWNVSTNTEILELPGVGLSIPDLVFERRKERGPVERTYLEVMGFWSRSAVWKRVELVQAGLGKRIVFAVSSRLRVSEEVLDGDLPALLYVYKHTMSARAIADRLERISTTPEPSRRSPVVVSPTRPRSRTRAIAKSPTKSPPESPKGCRGG
jgi:predicted nuclease of restriction endonuclease-like RecB superfamily